MWRLTVKAPAPWLTANARFKLSRWERAAHTKLWRDTTFTMAQQARLPTGLTRVRIDAIIHFPDGREVDPDGLPAALKPAIDALGPPFVRGGKNPASAPGYGLIPDDRERHLDGPHITIGVPGRVRPWGELVLHITDLTGLAAHRTWTPPRPTLTGGQRMAVKRACNGCSRLLGDVLDEEIEAAMAGLAPPDVTSECPTCTPKETS